MEISSLMVKQIKLVEQRSNMNNEILILTSMKFFFFSFIFFPIECTCAFSLITCLSYLKVFIHINLAGNLDFFQPKEQREYEEMHAELKVCTCNLQSGVDEMQYKLCVEYVRYFGYLDTYHRCYR